MDYKAAGVDIQAGEEAVSRIKTLVQRTFNANVLTGIGQFGGLYQFDPNEMQAPVLVSSADGVGTKLKIAFMTDRHDTIGQDLVNHCVNDILVMGARPLFFLDYIATGRLKPDVIEQVVGGLARACAENECALIGGETAEMPDFYADGEYDVAGFIVGVVERDNILDGSRIQPGDVVLGLASSGLHTNGYSLARAICFKQAHLSVHDRIPELDQKLGDALLAPHRSYAPTMLPALQSISIHGMAHITGGGLAGNLVRVLPEQCQAQIDLNAWDVPPLFQFLQERGEVSQAEMFQAFNMGIGLVIVLPEAAVDSFMTLAKSETVHRIGHIEAGHKGVHLV